VFICAHQLGWLIAARFNLLEHFPDIWIGDTHGLPECGSGKWQDTDTATITV
jgi:hypothetical protein